jgi:hypothetical protein
VLIYSPTVREKGGTFPKSAIYGCIDWTTNSAVCKFVKQLQTPLDVSIGRLWDNASQYSVLPTVKRVMEIMATTSSKYQ